MTWLCDSAELVSGGWLTSAYAGHGIRGDQVPSSGISGAPPLYNDLTLPADAAAEVRALVLTNPAAGTLEVDEDSSFYFYGAPDGTYTWTYAYYKDGAFVANNTVTIVVGAGTVTLTIANVAHGHTTGTLALSSDAYLTVDNALHGHAADNIGLSSTGSASLIVANALHGHATDSLVLSTQWLLAVADVLHGHAADSLALNTANSIFLAIQDIANAQAADSLLLSLDSWLAIADASHAHGVDSLQLSADAYLAIDSALHGHVLDNLWWNSIGLIIDDAYHAHSAESPLLVSSGSSSYPTAADIAAAIIAAAQISPLHVNVKKINDADVLGDGTPANKWRGF